MKFSEVIGQEKVKERLVKMVEENTLPHALMLCGDMGYGGLALAIAFASYLLGQREEGTNANIEAMLTTYQHPDLHFIVPVIRPPKTSADRKITTDDYIRQWSKLLSETPYFHFEEWLSRMKAENQQAYIYTAEGEIIAHRLSLKASQGGYKICIMWLPERMQTAFANKMLKLLEEPPPQTLFILVSEEPQMLLETIRSRMQRLDIRRIDDKEMHRALIEKRGIEESTAQQVVRIACGNWLKAIDFLDSRSEKVEFHEMFVDMVRNAYNRDTRGMKRWTEEIADYGREKQRRFLTYFSEQVRENFAYHFAHPEIIYMTPEEENFAKGFARFIHETNVQEILALVDRTMIAIGQNANPKFQFFDFALQITVLIRKR